jgi:hypothetical protein
VTFRSDQAQLPHDAKQLLKHMKTVPESQKPGENPGVVLGCPLNVFFSDFMVAISGYLREFLGYDLIQSANDRDF